MRAAIEQGRYSSSLEVALKIAHVFGEPVEPVERVERVFRFPDSA